MEPQIISDKNKVLAIFFSKRLKVKVGQGIRFLTPENYSLQIGLLEHKKRWLVPPHIHRDLVSKAKTRKSQEFVYVEKGQNIVVKVFNSTWQEMAEIMMSTGDFILFVSGGHSLDIPPACRLLEVKTGPYPGDNLAKIFKN